MSFDAYDQRNFVKTNTNMFKDSDGNSGEDNPDTGT